MKTPLAGGWGWTWTIPGPEDQAWTKGSDVARGRSGSWGCRWGSPGPSTPSVLSLVIKGTREGPDRGPKRTGACGVCGETEAHEGGRCQRPIWDLRGARAVTSGVGGRLVPAPTSVPGGRAGGGTEARLRMRPPVAVASGRPGRGRLFLALDTAEERKGPGWERGQLPGHRWASLGPRPGGVAALLAEAPCLGPEPRAAHLPVSPSSGEISSLSWRLPHTLPAQRQTEARHRRRHVTASPPHCVAVLARNPPGKLSARQGLSALSRLAMSAWPPAAISRVAGMIPAHCHALLFPIS